MRMSFLKKVRKILQEVEEDIHISLKKLIRNYGLYSFRNRIATYWNRLPDTLMKLNNRNNFKKGLDHCLGHITVKQLSFYNRESGEWQVVGGYSFGRHRHRHRRTTDTGDVHCVGRREYGGFIKTIPVLGGGIKSLILLLVSTYRIPVLHMVTGSDSIFVFFVTIHVLSMCVPFRLLPVPCALFMRPQICALRLKNAPLNMRLAPKICALDLLLILFFSPAFPSFRQTPYYKKMRTKTLVSYRYLYFNLSTFY